MADTDIQNDANEETGIVNHDDDEYCQHKFILDVVDSDEFEDADAIIVSISRGNEVIPFAWGDNLVQIRGLAEITADFYKAEPTDF